MASFTLFCSSEGGYGAQNCCGLRHPRAGSAERADLRNPLSFLLGLWFNKEGLYRDNPHAQEVCISTRCQRIIWRNHLLLPCRWFLIILLPSQAASFRELRLSGSASLSLTSPRQCLDTVSIICLSSGWQCTPRAPPAVHPFPEQAVVVQLSLQSLVQQMEQMAEEMKPAHGLRAEVGWVARGANLGN